ncbi:hypothetical protein [Rhodococcus sp. IEGM 1330]|uniref:hypothetical protein n=1 Tax=Rhodococcus sp. IEGM 1330 TaxID=3082225 RepID=UPI002954975E|nr:hypothetical protein [Rhodococcus sp. IEGM 1330]MDV8024955.1 hypothetical protein [Rhodococcus sp. IEGM 1330]
MALSEEVRAKLMGAGVGKKSTRKQIMEALTYQPHPDVLADVEYTGNLEEDSTAEVAALQQGLSGHAKEWAAKFKTMNDSEFWCAFCFESRAHKERFLQLLSLSELGDKYLDGHEAAKRLGLELDEKSVE